MTSRLTADARNDAAAPSGDAPPAATGSPDSRLELDLLAGDLRAGRLRVRWMGWRLRLLVAAALIGCIAIVLLARWLAEPPRIDATWTATADGRVELAATRNPALRPYVGKTLVALSSAADAWVPVNALALHRSSRWLIDDTERAQHLRMHGELSNVLSAPEVELVFGTGERYTLPLAPRGLDSLGLLFWLLCGLALVLFMLATVVALAEPSTTAYLYALMALCQSGNLLFIAIESTLDLSLPAPFPHLDMPLRLVFDFGTVAAGVHSACLHPVRMRFAVPMAAVIWSITALLVTALITGALSSVWWWAQSGLTLWSLVGIGLLVWSYRQAPHPFGLVVRRFVILVASTWVLLTLALAAVDRAPAMQQQFAAVGPMIWYVFFASMLLLIPFLSKPQQVMREFALLAGISTVATSLDLLFVAVFSLGQFTSLTLALFFSLAVYTGARQWLLDQLMGSSVITTERMFESLYRIARAVEAKPDRLPALLQQLLHSLFEPIETVTLQQLMKSPQVAEAGATLFVPIPDVSGRDEPPTQVIAMRFARRGRHLFTEDDARLAGRIIEQLSRAVAHDKAVEQGRNEERLRLAQDLHDDIGARLLTLMYQSPNAEMEEYARHTLQDLKTLTRGLAAAQHRLSHAAAEWKTDLTQRLSAAQIRFVWDCSFDDDVLLTVVQWSALTRVLRELVSNVIAHSGASRVEVRLQLAQERLELTLTDDGHGREPQRWAHGLGLGGVRKRVKQLGGEVRWEEAEPRGIRCRVLVPHLTERPA